MTMISHMHHMIDPDDVRIVCLCPIGHDHTEEEFEER